MQLRDPFLQFVSNGHLILLSAGFELLIVIVIGTAVLKRNLALAVHATIWCASVMTVYRLGVYTVADSSTSCKCLGAGSPFTMRGSRADLFSLLSLGYMLGGGLTLHYFCKRRGRTLAGDVVSCGKPRYTRVPVLLSLFLMPAHAASSSEISYEYFGLLERKMVVAPDSEVLIGSLAFTFYTDTGTNWAFEGHQALRMAVGDEYKSLIISGFDGKSVFSVHYANERMNEQGHRVPVESFDQAIHPASVSPGASHFGENMWGPALWFSLVASTSPEVARLKDLPPIYGGLNGKIHGSAFELGFEVDPMARAISKATWKLKEIKLSYESLLRLPEVLVPDSPEEAAAAADHIAELEAKRNWRSVDSTYEVFAFAEAAGRYYPKEFLITEFTWDAQLPKEAAKLKIYGSVTNVVQVPRRASVLPYLRGKQSVADYRLRIKGEGVARNEVKYLLTDSTWITDTNDVRLQRIAVQWKPTPIPKVPRTRLWLSRFVFLLFVAILLVPPLIVWRRGRKRASGELYRKSAPQGAK